MTQPAEPDLILYLALVNGWAKDAHAHANRWPAGDPRRAALIRRREYLYAVKVAAAARLAHLDLLRLGLVDYDREYPAALLVGESAALGGPHAFHFPLPLHAWALTLPRAPRVPERRNPLLPLLRAAAPPKEEVIAALLALPPVPRAVRREWRLRNTRPTWSQIEQERAAAPGGVPTRRRPRPEA